MDLTRRLLNVIILKIPHLTDDTGVSENSQWIYIHYTAGTRAGDVERIKKTGKGIRYGSSSAHLGERPEICPHLFSSDPV